MTDDTNDTTNGEAAENHLFPGYFAEDREDAATLVVIADTDRKASQHTVQAAGETVAELNPNYPADDNVLFACYRNTLDDAFGETWRSYTPEYLAFIVGDRGVPVYSFPESRLERKPGEWEDEDDVGAGMAGAEDAEQEGEDDE